MIVVARTIGSLTVGGNTDKVLGAMALPKGGKLMSVQGEVHVIGEEDQPTDKFMAYGFSGQMVDIQDPETTQQYQDIWDDVVVKASDPIGVAATNNLDFDWLTNDTVPEIEPGEMDIDALLGLTQAQKEFIPPRLEWISWAKNKQGGFIAGTPDDFLPSDFKTFRSNRKLVAETPSALMLTVSSPVLDETQVIAAHSPPSSAGEWYMLANLKETMRDFGKMNAGLTEAGAISPYLNASVLIGDTVAPDMIDESTTQYNAMSWQALVVATWVLEFPSESIPNTLDGR